MLCPKCKTEAKIQKAVNVIKDGKLYRRLHFVCRDKNCTEYEKEVGTEETELPVVKE